METQELHRGRLIDHIQLVVKDLPASQAFYSAVFDVLGMEWHSAVLNRDPDCPVCGNDRRIPRPARNAQATDA